MHQAGFEPARQAATIAKGHALAIVPRLSHITAQQTQNIRITFVHLSSTLVQHCTNVIQMFCA